MATSTIKLAKQTLYNELWSGTWSSGSITVTDSDKYAMFIAISDDTPLIGVRMSDTQIKFFGLIDGTRVQWAKAVTVTNSGNSWTFGSSVTLGHNASGNHSAAGTVTINKIIGIIPY